MTSDNRDTLNLKIEAVDYFFDWFVCLYRRKLTWYLIMVATCITLSITLCRTLDRKLTTFALLPEHRSLIDGISPMNIEQQGLSDKLPANLLVFDSLFGSDLTNGSQNGPLSIKLNINEDQGVMVSGSFARVRRELRATRKKIKMLASANTVLVLKQNAPNGGERRSNSRSSVIFKIHQQRRKLEGRTEITINDVLSNKIMPNTAIWENYHKLICDKGLPSSKSDEIVNILRSSVVTKVDEIERGTQVKLQITFSDGTIAVVKPKRVSRHYQTPINHFYFTDVERHTAEIAAFHVDRLLGFNRVPPTTGRRFNIQEEIKSLAVEDLLSTFFISPAGNECFRGQCKNYCDTAHAVCSENGFIEASVQLMLPIAPEVTWVRMSHPYRRSYSAKHMAEWETNPEYCVDSVFIDQNFQSRLLLDMVDMSVFDFLIHNLDRHHLVKIDELGEYSTTFHIDQGRGFGVHTRDDMSILAPLTQCCFIRFSTLDTLSKFSLSGTNSLGDRVRRAMLGDPLSPVLINEHLLAIDRRLSKVFNEVSQCIQSVGDITRVVIDDGN